MLIKRKAILSASIGAALVLSGSAFAGNKATQEVIATTTTISGALGSVRNSDDQTQSLYCKDYGASAYCYAKDASGNSASCTTSDSTHLSVIRGWKDSGYIYIRYDENGTCTRVETINGSPYEPKQQ